MKSLFGRLALLLIAVFSLFSVFGTSGFAQDLDQVTISGKVADPNNAPIVGATVTATLIETGVERTFVTNEDGRYRIIELSPGTYRVKVSATGFGAKEKTDLQTISGQNVQIDFTLAPGDVAIEQTVTIEEDATAVDTT
ncbi:MAG: carboxypeptidase-like regulatory domain-containing protein, partial [Acidobacteriota bacterium]|nr:carboxypeptidase-like regulatory domain-containing protein [Acidobacteriota bacterium]